MGTFTRYAAYLVAWSLLAGCASVTGSIGQPGVKLKNVRLGSFDFSRQTFVLGFDVVNPNPFPLPVNYVRYAVQLDDQRFASGETVAAFTVPANGKNDFAISVELDLLRSAPQLLYTVRDGMTRELSYELSGKLGIDLPLVEPVSFKSSGMINVAGGDMVTRATKRATDETL